jgi:hypothetical protein
MEAERFPPNPTCRTSLGSETPVRAACFCCILRMRKKNPISGMEFRTRLNGPADGADPGSCAVSLILLPLSTRLSLTLLVGSG